MQNVRSDRVEQVPVANGYATIEMDVAHIMETLKGIPEPAVRPRLKRTNPFMRKLAYRLPRPLRFLLSHIIAFIRPSNVEELIDDIFIADLLRGNYHEYVCWRSYIDRVSPEETEELWMDVVDLHALRMEVMDKATHENCVGCYRCVYDDFPKIQTHKMFDKILP